MHYQVLSNIIENIIASIIPFHQTNKNILNKRSQMSLNH